MNINDFEKMQQNLKIMKNNLEYIEHKETNFKEKKCVAKEVNKIRHSHTTKIVREEQTIVMITIAIVAFTFIFSTSIFAQTMSENVVENELVQNEQEDNVGQAQNIVLEENENVIPLEDILMENVSILKSKEYAEEERTIDFETIYIDNPNLPEGEEIMTSQGKQGRKQVKVIKSYENNVFVSEEILETKTVENYIPEYIDKGTSKFLKNNNVHLGDTMYVTKDVSLFNKSSNSSDEIMTILEGLDVTLQELDGEDWCKINFDGNEGYIQTKFLTTSDITPEIIEKNRTQRIKLTLSPDIPLNISTDLTLEDYKKVLSGNSLDKYHIIEDNMEIFFHMDKKYNINGIFLASIAIHESAWGSSKIAQNKKNLFGYGAYDSSPYQSSYSFGIYAEGIETVAKALVKYYINEPGTLIYDDEVAKGSYYNGPTVAGVNIRYASDKEWHNKVYRYMEYLYNKL